MNTETQLATQQDRETVEYVPFGSDQKIKLSLAIIEGTIAVPTRSGKKPSRQDCIKFMMLCRARHLNPFEGDAFLLGYDTQDGPQFSLITAEQVFHKRAEASEHYDGIRSGIVVDPPVECRVCKGVGFIGEKLIECPRCKGRGADDEIEGHVLPEGHKLVGGWATVRRKDRSEPFRRRLPLAAFTTGRSRWAKDPAGMIAKCARAGALREAFPTHLGGLFDRDEIVEANAVVIPEGKLGKAALPEPAPETITERAKREKKTRKEGDESSTPATAHETPADEKSTTSDAPSTPPTQESKSAPTFDPEGAENAITLRQLILNRAKNELNVSKGMLPIFLEEIGVLQKGQPFESLTAKEATALLETRWQDLVNCVKGK